MAACCTSSAWSAPHAHRMMRSRLGGIVAPADQRALARAIARGAWTSHAALPRLRVGRGAGRARRDEITPSVAGEVRSASMAAPLRPSGGRPCQENLMVGR
jgi:hypothetical protein